MKAVRIIAIFLTAAIGFGCLPSTDRKANFTCDPLSEWNEGPSKVSILAFIKTATDESSPEFIPIEKRVAVFDMDGTILLEKPNPVNFDVVIQILIEQMKTNPELAQKQPYKAIHEQDWSYFDMLGYTEDGLYGILLDATLGYTESQYRDFILKYFKTVRDKRFNKPYDQMVFVPMVQLIQYLEDNEFDVYIVSGSDPEFTRTISEKAMHVPVQNVIGTTILTKWIETDTGSYFVRLHEFVKPINDEGGKAVNILNKVGRVPAIAIGNSPGDYAMLQYSKNAPFNLQMIVNHDDSLREYYYDTKKMKKLCQENGWHEISMQDDFKVVFKE
ncbi:MAG: hypothetical protein C0591_10905 [Marinilabiliales bacterium]|nr:MAG: hypothetical protein C0591_10905 [Marinilabiliales bacterium]